MINNKVIKSAKSNLKKIAGKNVNFSKKDEKKILNLSKLGLVELDILSLHLEKENLQKKAEIKNIAATICDNPADRSLKALITKIKTLDNQIKDLKVDVEKITKSLLNN